MSFNLYNNLLGKDHYHPHFMDEKNGGLQRSLDYHIAEAGFEFRASDSTTLTFSHYARLFTYLH